jgi:Tol biopolymer transport system component
MACDLRTVPALVAPCESVARRPCDSGHRIAVEGARLLAGCYFALQLGCSLDDRHPLTAEGEIQSSGGTAGASHSDDAALAVSSRGSAGADMGLGVAANPGEGVPLPRLTDVSDAGMTSPMLTEALPEAGSTTTTPPELPTTAACDTSRSFQAPVLVPGLTSTAGEYGLWLTPDELTAYFASTRRDLAGPGNYDLYRAQRSTIAEPFQQPSIVPLVNSEFVERKAVLSADGLQLFFSSDRPGLGTGEDIYVSVRPNPSSEFGAPGLLSGINSEQADLVHSTTNDGRYLYFDRPVAGAGRDIFLFDLATAATRPVTELESSYDDGHALASADGLAVYWATTRVSLDDSDGRAESDIWSARRASPTDPLGNLMPVPELNTSSAETVHYLSEDGCRIYIGSDRSGRAQLYVAARP